MSDRYTTADDCARIVRASVDPDRILAGPDGYEGSEPDILLTTVEKVVRRHRAGAVRAAAVRAAAAQLRGEMNTFPMHGAHTRAGWAVNRLADRIEGGSDA